MSSWISIPLIDDTDAFIREELITSITGVVGPNGEKRCTVRTSAEQTFHAKCSASDMTRRICSVTNRQPAPAGQDASDCLIAAIKQAIADLTADRHPAQGLHPVAKTLMQVLEAFG